MQHFNRISIFIAALLFALTGVAGNPSAMDKGLDDAIQALVQADRDFDRATDETGTDGWVSYFADDGMMFGNDGSITKGTDAIREVMAPVFANPDFSLRWEPVGADVSRADDLGYTHGNYILTTTGSEGKKVTLYGKYVTIWKKHPDGTWKVVVDIGTAPKPAPPPAEAN